MGRLSAQAAGGAVEGGVAVGEDAPVGGHQPVALAVGGGGHPHDGPVERQTAGGAVEGGVAVGEDAPVGGHQPVALAVGGGGHPHDGPVEGRTAGGTVEGGVAVGEEVPVGGPERVGLRRGQHRDQAGQDEHDRQDDGASDAEIPSPPAHHGPGSVRGWGGSDGCKPHSRSHTSAPFAAPPEASAEVGRCGCR